MQIAYFLYHTADDNVFETCLKTLYKHSKCGIIVTTDNVPEAKRKAWQELYGVAWDIVSKEDYEGKGAYCKIKRMLELFSICPDGTEIAILDADLYFLSDPFYAFREFEQFNLGLTTRCHEYHFKINGGVFYFRMCPGLRSWLSYHLEESFNPTWDKYMDYRRRFDHERFGLDWTIGQDFLNVCWENKDFVESKFGISIQDVGWKYNYCPSSDKLGKQEAENLMLKAYKNRSVYVLHLKSKFKDFIYQRVFSDSVTSNPRGTLRWARLREKLREERRKDPTYINWRDKKR